MRVGRTDHEAGDVPRRRSGHEEPLAGLDVLHRPQRHRPEQVVVDVHGVEGTRGRRRPVRATRATVDVEGHRPAVEVEPVADEGQVAAEQDDVGGRQLLQPPLVVLVDRGGEITGIGRLVREHPQRGGPDLPVVADDDDPGQRPPGAEHQDHQDERRHDPEAERKAEQERGEGGEHHAGEAPAQLPVTFQPAGLGLVAVSGQGHQVDPPGGSHRGEAGPEQRTDDVVGEGGSEVRRRAQEPGDRLRRGRRSLVPRGRAGRALIRTDERIRGVPALRSPARRSRNVRTLVHDHCPFDGTARPPGTKA